MVWLDLGGTLQLKPVISPASAAAEYSWKSSSAKIATVDKEGTVTAMGKGIATITVTATYGKIKKTASVKVKVVTPGVVDALVIDAPNPLRIKVGESCTFGIRVMPASASENVKLDFNSNKGNIAIEYDEDGYYAIGLRAGTTILTVKDVNSGVKTTLKVIVSK